MTVWDSLPWVAFWLCACITIVACSWFHRSKHEHKWVEKRRDTILRNNGDRVGEGVFCVCEACGEHKMFRMKI